jgi:hypothetical protein
MSTGDWIALIMPALVVAGAAWSGVKRLTRMTLAVENLADTLKSQIATAADHERRLIALEVKGRTRAASRD